MEHKGRREWEHFAFLLIGKYVRFRCIGQYVFLSLLIQSQLSVVYDVK